MRTFKYILFIVFTLFITIIASVAFIFINIAYMIKEIVLDIIYFFTNTYEDINDTLLSLTRLYKNTVFKK